MHKTISPYLALLTTLVMIATVTTSMPVLAANILFDQGHRQAFLYNDDKALGLSQFSDILARKGHKVSASHTPLTTELLQQVDALIISGPFKPFSQTEQNIIADFVGSGGKLLVMIHIPHTVGALLASLNIDVSNFPLHEIEHTIAQEDKNFRVKDLSEHWLFDNISSFNLYGGWALRAQGNPQASLAKTSAHAWLDINNNRLKDSADMSSSFAVIVHKKLHQGDILVFADDAIFQNRFLTANNKQMAQNIAAWLAQ
ncbi:DUF4350 domain-containing protein [Thalassotalea aquiviva]|uniref:DUF4350 domain-containing protein n=1 Tax=Thalassotalea aquiviva TaxID=3242415 RepID=UPI00352B0BC9